MVLIVSHILDYQYADLVFLERQHLFLAPKAYPQQIILNHLLQIEPTPTKVIQNMSAEGNTEHIAYFTGATRSLHIQSEMRIQSEEFNVFDFVLFPFETERLPFKYDENKKLLLEPYLIREGTGLIEQFARQAASSVRWKTVDFLTYLCRHIADNFVYEKREQGQANPPDVTLNAQKGSCRDFVQLFIASCRSMGIAARFVSGYLYGSNHQAHELHAWAEVYLPGAGWRGFDPTEGRAIGNHYICLATSADPAHIVPVSGMFRGYASSELKTKIEIKDINL